MGYVMRWRGPLAIAMMVIALVLLASVVSADGSSLFRLNNERNAAITAFDIQNASSEELAKTEYIKALNTSLVYADIDIDGFPEIFYCSADGKLIQYSTVDDSFKVVIEDEVAFYTHTPQVVDVDLDGSFEVLLYNPMVQAIQCFDISSGKKEWGITNPNAHHGIYPQPKVLIDKDTNESRILVLLGPGTLVLLDGKGNELWRLNIELADPTSYHVPTMGVEDLDMDGDLEVVVSSTKRLGDGPRFVELDIYSLDPPELLRTFGVPGDEERWNYASSPPLITDLYQLIEGQEIIVGTIYGGIAAISSMDGTVLWNHSVDGDRRWEAIQTVWTEKGLWVMATSFDELIIFDASGQVVYQTHGGINGIRDIPQVGYFDPGTIGQCVMFGRGGSVQVIDPVTGRYIWGEHGIDYNNKMKFLIVEGRKDVAMELHTFYYHRDKEGDRVKHRRYWIPEAEDRTISVDPTNWTWYPNITVKASGMMMNGAPVDFHWIVVRLYQGTAFDRLTLHRWPEFAQLRRMTTYRVASYMSGFGTDGIDNENSSIYMEIDAHWYFALFGNIHLHITAYYTDGSALTVDIRDYLRCEQGLVTGGELELVDSEGIVYIDGDWAPGGVDATLQGVVLTFPDGLHVPDPGDVHLVILMDGTFLNASLGPNGAIAGSFHLPDRSGEFTITLGIASLWTNFRSNHTITILLDIDPPEFHSFFPENGTWLAEVDIMTGCQMTDGDGSGVGSVQVRYWLLGDPPGEWEDVDTKDRPYCCEARTILHIDEGIWYVRWRATDRVGNGPVASPAQTINVDLTGVLFRDFGPEDWVISTPVDVTVTVEDAGGSGVDLQSIEYSYSTAGLFNFTKWASAGLSGTREQVTVTLTIPFEEGAENVVVMRAADVVGNIRSSTAYIVSVDLTPPEFHDPFPGTDDVVMNKTSVECSIYVDDAFSGVDKVEYQYSVAGGTQSEWMVAQAVTGPGPLWTAEVPRNDEGPTTVRWRASDKAGGEMAYSDVFVVNLNRPPEITELAPTSPVEVRGGESVEFSVKLLDPEGDDLAILWLLDGEEVSENDTFSSGFSLGSHEVSLILDDGHGNVVEETVLVTSVERTELKEGEGWPYLLIFLVIIVIVVVVVLMLRTKD
jgi:hypothetical protein